MTPSNICGFCDMPHPFGLFLCVFALCVNAHTRYHYRWELNLYVYRVWLLGWSSVAQKSVVSWRTHINPNDTPTRINHIATTIATICCTYVYIVRRNEHIFAMFRHLGFICTENLVTMRFTIRQTNNIASQRRSYVCFPIIHTKHRLHIHKLSADNAHARMCRRTQHYIYVFPFYRRTPSASRCLRSRAIYSHRAICW